MYNPEKKRKNLKKKKKDVVFGKRIDNLKIRNIKECLLKTLLPSPP